MNIYYLQRLARLKEDRTCYFSDASLFQPMHRLSLGGFTPESYLKLSQIFNFDYMGNCEYEDGDTAIAFQKIHDNWIDYGCFDYGVVTKEGNEGDVYIICSPSVVREVKVWLIKKAKHENKIACKNHVGLQDSINKSGAIAGWIDIYNHFMFFTDKTMFEKMVEHFNGKRIEYIRDQVLYSKLNSSNRTI